MANAPNTVDTLNGLFKTQYAPDLNDLIPQHAIEGQGAGHLRREASSHIRPAAVAERRHGGHTGRVDDAMNGAMDAPRFRHHGGQRPEVGHIRLPVERTGTRRQRRRVRP